MRAVTHVMAAAGCRSHRAYAGPRVGLDPTTLWLTTSYELLRAATWYFATDVRCPGVLGVGMAPSVASPVR